MHKQPRELTGDGPHTVRGTLKTGQNENPLDTHSQNSGNSGESFKATINEKYDYERYFIGYYRTEDTCYDNDGNEERTSIWRRLKHRVQRGLQGFRSRLSLFRRSRVTPVSVSSLETVSMSITKRHYSANYFNEHAG